ncbi:hypothetical protein A3Q56_07287, partial [Intoshia linei]
TFQSAKGKTTCINCTEGYYCTGGNDPVQCPKGKYCPTKTSANIPFCPVGTYNPSFGKKAITDCLKCKAKYYCNKPGLIDFDTVTADYGIYKCAAGYYCVSGNYFGNPPISTSSIVGQECPKGYVCPEGTETPVPCPKGKYRNNVRGVDITQDCYACPPSRYCDTAGTVDPINKCDGGYYCTSGSDSAAPTVVAMGGICGKGTYCTIGSREPTDCQPGTYGDVTGLSVCKQCPAGYFCPRKTSEYLSNRCAIGHYCPAGTHYSTQYKCPIGTFRATDKGTSVNDCTSCTAGKYCESEGLAQPTGCCDAGYYCIKGSHTKKPKNIISQKPVGSTCSTSIGDICPIGSICAACSSLPQLCPTGKYCASQGLTTPSGNCDAGYYCVSGSKTKDPIDGVTGNICKSGHYCSTGTTTTLSKCPIGTFLPTTGNTQLSNCKSCPSGKYCATTGLSAVTGNCKEGYYCPTGSKVATEKTCSRGHYCPTGSTIEIECDIGYYQDNPTQNVCKLCSAGSYTDVKKAESCKPCPEKYFCQNGKKNRCSVGHYCPQSTPTEVACPKGTFSSTPWLASLDKCTDCKPGTFCGSTALTKVTGPCNGGYFCKTGVDSATPDGVTNTGTGGICRVGYYCPIGSSDEILCPAGTYNDEISKITCKSCVIGFACPVGSSSYIGIPCDKGHYCPINTISKTEYPCPIGI